MAVEVSFFVVCIGLEGGHGRVDVAFRRIEVILSWFYARSPLAPPPSPPSGARRFGAGADAVEEGLTGEV